MNQKIENGNTKISLEFAQKIYDVANIETKRLLTLIYPECMLNADLTDLSDTYGIISSTIYIFKASSVKNMVDEPKPWSDSCNINIMVELYPTLMQIPDDKVLLVYYAVPREGNSYINGFSILKPRKNDC